MIARCTRGTSASAARTSASGASTVQLAQATALPHCGATASKAPPSRRVIRPLVSISSISASASRQAPLATSALVSPEE
ncbi:MAG: hypothetical protein IPK27_00220 [Rhodanobacteraceae bacterium]|nr:hypothetical protein [Rhodanobacteraceae bacterium]